MTERAPFLSFGIIGCRHGHVLGLIKELLAVPGVRCAGVYDADPASLKAVTDRFPVGAVSSPEALLDDPNVSLIGTAEINKLKAPIILRALEAPLRQIADNAGIDGSVVADEVGQKPHNFGYDANKGAYVDMLKAGIIDPVKVVRTALANAASISGLLLTTEALVTTYDKEDKKKRSVEGAVR